MDTYQQLNGYENFNNGVELSNFYFVQKNIGDPLTSWEIIQDNFAKYYVIFVW